MVRHWNRFLKEAPSLEMFKAKLEQPGLVEGVPAHGEEVGTRYLRSLLTQTILRFYTMIIVSISESQVKPTCPQIKIDTRILQVHTDFLNKN